LRGCDHVSADSRIDWRLAEYRAVLPPKSTGLIYRRAMSWGTRVFRCGCMYGARAVEKIGKAEHVEIRTAHVETGALTRDEMTQTARWAEKLTVEL
jgi:hypothetical protein